MKNGFASLFSIPLNRTINNVQLVLYLKNTVTQCQVNSNDRHKSLPGGGDVSKTERYSFKVVQSSSRDSL